MDSRTNHPVEAASAAVTDTNMPRDETATTGPDPDPKMDNSADLLDKSDYGSEDFADNPGKSLCVHALSSYDEDMGGTEDENIRGRDQSVDYNGKETGSPTAASTPLREEMNRFRIVDTEPGESEISGINKITDATHTAAAVGVAASGEEMETNSDANSAVGDAHSAVEENTSRGSGTKTTGDANTAEHAQIAGDANSATIVSPGDANTAGRGEANAADGNKTAQSNIIPLILQKVPAMFKEPLPPQPKPAAEPPATPSATYKAIMGGRCAKNSNSILSGTGTVKSQKNCGSFFNQGDNRVLRSVYKENVATLTVSSLSFNPVSWECSACPKKHSILGGGGGNDFSSNEGGRTVIILADQNFPAVLPTASGSCLAIIRIDQGKIKDLVDLLFSISPEEFPPGTIFVLGSLTHLQGEGLHGYAAAGVKAGKRIASQFPDAYSVLFTPPPYGRV